MDNGREELNEMIQSFTEWYVNYLNWIWLLEHGFDRKEGKDESLCELPL